MRAIPDSLEAKCRVEPQSWRIARSDLELQERTSRDRRVLNHKCQEISSDPLASGLGVDRDAPQLTGVDDDRGTRCRDESAAFTQTKDRAPTQLRQPRSLPPRMREAATIQGNERLELIFASTPRPRTNSLHSALILGLFGLERSREASEYIAQSASAVADRQAQA